MSPLPRISLITPSFQQAEFLEECIRSVHDQGYADLEHIVVDGGSTDGSKTVLERSAKSFAWWCSEKDTGQSDAINKGLAHATGGIFGWLNSDDALLPGTLERVAAAFSADPALRVFGGNTVHRLGENDIPFTPLNDATDEAALFTDPVINQPATFWRMDVVRSIGGVDPALRYVMDLELWWQLLFRMGTAHLRFEPVPLAIFRVHEGSKTSTSMLHFLDEIATLLHGLCERTQLPELAAVLREGHRLRPDTRGIPADAGHRDHVRRMTVHFLLKWNTEIHRENQFRIMKAFRALDGSMFAFTPQQQERLVRLDEQLRSGSWNLFRAKRKLGQLFNADSRDRSGKS